MKTLAEAIATFHMDPDDPSSVASRMVAGDKYDEIVADIIDHNNAEDVQGLIAAQIEHFDSRMGVFLLDLKEDPGEIKFKSLCCMKAVFAAGVCVGIEMEKQPALLTIPSESPRGPIDT